MVRTIFASQLKSLLDSLYPNSYSLKIKDCTNHDDPLKKLILRDQGKLTRFKAYYPHGIMTDFRILIYFPEIEITNSAEVTHTIYDYVLFIHFTLTKVAGETYKISYPHLEGKSLSANTFNAVNFGYMHSHQRSNSARVFDTFCLGETSLSVFIEKLTKITVDIQRMDEVTSYLDMFLVEVEQYLKWESLEGGPYKTMSSHVYVHNYQISNKDVCKDLHYQMKSYIKQKEQSPIEIRENAEIYITDDFLNNFYDAKLGQIKGTGFKFFNCDTDKFLKYIYKRADNAVRDLASESSIYNVGNIKVMSRHIKVEIAESDIEFIPLNSIKSKLEKLIRHVYKHQILELLSVPEEEVPRLNNPQSSALASFRRAV